MMNFLKLSNFNHRVLGKKFKKAIYTVIMISFVINMSSVGVFFVTSNAQAADDVTIFNDEFESGDFSAWTFVKSPKWVFPNNGRGVKVTEDTREGNDNLMKAISTEGFKNITLNYWHRVTNKLESSDHVYVEWYDGDNWNILKNFTNKGNSEWKQKNHEIDGAKNLSDFRIRFRAHLERRNANDKDTFRLDDVLLTGDEMTYCGDDIWEEINDYGEEEECDGENNVGEGEICTQDCTLRDLTYCGDGIMQEINDDEEEEKCDGEEGVGEHQVCTEECTLEDLTYCGDGIWQEVNEEEEEEECDGEDNVEEDQFCASNCMIMEKDAPYCGDGENNQIWEQCDGEKGCNDKCLPEEPTECNDLVLARVNVDNYSNKGEGNVSSDIYLPLENGKVKPIPAGTWFAVYNDGEYVVDADVSEYRDVEGLAVQRLEGSVRAVLYGSYEKAEATSTIQSKEHVDGTIEFYNANTTEVLDDSAHKLEKGFDGTTGGPGNDEASSTDNGSTFWMTVTTANDGYYTNWQIVEDCQLTIRAHKIICESEDLLPNWGEKDNKSDVDAITPETAQTFVDETEGCDFSKEPWEFQWGTKAPNPKLQGNFYGKYDHKKWHDFDTQTDGSKPAEAYINLEDPKKLWAREVLKEGYIPFAFPPKPKRGLLYSAEFYCHNDVLNYDNLDVINFSSKTLDNKYYCVAFNVALPDPVVKVCKYDDSENLLSDWVINIRGEEEYSDSQTTDESGCVEFTEMPEYGSYTISEEMKENWKQIFPGEDGTMTVDFQGKDLEVSFINEEADILGCKYLDEDENGEINDGEETLSGWEIELSSCYVPFYPETENLEDSFTDTISTSTEMICEVVATTTTGEDGCYSFYGLEEESEYKVSEVLQEGWVQTYPESGSYDISFPSEITSGYDFANYHDGPAEYCGDDICQDLETCSSCSKDCGSCSRGGGNFLASSGLVISNVQSYLDPTNEYVTAVITWLTNKAATSRVVYDTVSHPDAESIGPLNYGYANSTTEDTNKKTGHNVTISNLSPNTAYYFRAISSASPEVLSEEKTFVSGEDGVTVLGESGAPNLVLTSIVNKEFANPGDTDIEYTIAVVNEGNLASYSTTLANVLPEGFTYSEEGVDGNWDLGDIEEGETKTITYKISVSESTEAGTYINSATVISSNHEPVSAETELEIRAVEVLAETGFSLNELLFLILSFLSAGIASLYLRKKLA